MFRADQHTKRSFAQREILSQTLRLFSNYLIYLSTVWHTLLYHTVCMIASSTTRYLVRKYESTFEGTKIDTFVRSVRKYFRTKVLLRKYFRTKVLFYFRKSVHVQYVYTYCTAVHINNLLPEVFYLRLRSLYARRYSTKVLSYYFRKYNERCTFKYESKKRYFRSYFRK